MERKICGICKKEYEGFGNNPHPIETISNDRCCDSCNINIVIPVRLFISKEIKNNGN
ncbi:MAG: hypothetical protein LBD23_14755 [Oscillospiraceae bacterium]|jgi:hypothetical protein|nr:hypothetical protein [Oscillospiraceae bacterium]